MEEKTLVCIGCPKGCNVYVQLTNHEITKISGCECKIGKVYAQKELTNPTRTITSTIRVKGKTLRMLPVKTKEEIPKDKIFSCMKELKDIELIPPIMIGDIVVENIGGTGVNIIATKDILN